MNTKDKSVFAWFGWTGLGLFSWFMWIVSSFLSYWGFTHLAPNIPWWVKLISIGFSIGINFVEFMLDKMSTEELMDIKNIGDAVLRLFGFVCYLYDIWTNVLGFLILLMGLSDTVNFISAFHTDPIMAVFAILFGISFAVGPEPLYIKYLKEKFKYPYIPKYQKTQGYYNPQYRTAQATQATYAAPKTDTVSGKKNVSVPAFYQTPNARVQKSYFDNDGDEG